LSFTLTLWITADYAQESEKSIEMYWSLIWGYNINHTQHAVWFHKNAMVRGKFQVAENIWAKNTETQHSVWIRFVHCY